MTEPRDTIPGYEGTVGPFPSQYGQPHVYARDVHSGAGNCVCGRWETDQLHIRVVDITRRVELAVSNVLALYRDRNVASPGPAYQVALSELSKAMDARGSDD